MNFTKHTEAMVVVETVIKEKAFLSGLGGGYNFTGELKTEHDERSDKPESIDMEGKGWGDQFVSRKVLGGFTREWHTAEVSHGVKDNMGRELGHRLAIYRERDGWEVNAHATRAGKAYGACNRGTKCATFEEAVAMAEKKAAAGKKAAAKAALKGGHKK